MVTISTLFHPERMAKMAESGLRYAGGEDAVEQWRKRCLELAQENPDVPQIEIMLAAGLDIEQQYFGTFE
jgi:hypothetical protein